MTKKEREGKERKRKKEGFSGHVYFALFFRLRYRMAGTTYGATQKYFGEKTANFSDETTEEEAKSVYDERATNYGEVIFIVSVF